MSDTEETGQVEGAAPGNPPEEEDQQGKPSPAESPPAEPETAEEASPPEAPVEEPPKAPPSMVELASADELDRLEEVWLDRTESGGPVEPFIEATASLLAKGNIERAATLVALLAETLLSADRHGDALRSLRPAAAVKGRDKDIRPIRPLVLRALAAMHGGEEWYRLFLTKSGLEEGRPLWEAMEIFDTLLSFRPGSPVLHYGENRPARIETLDPEDEMTLLRFPDGAQRRLSLDVVQELFGPLDPDDWRGAMMTRPESLREEALESPGGIIRKVARARGGRASSPQIKTDLFGQVIPQAKWNSWWKRAKDEATRDPYIAVEGSKSRPVFALRGKPVSLDEEAGREVRWAKGLSEMVARAVYYRAEGVSEETARELTGVVARRLEEDQKKIRKKEPGALLEASLVVEQWGDIPALDPSEILNEALEDGEDAAMALARLVQTVPTRQGREMTFGRLRSLLREDWADRLWMAVGLLSGPPVDEAVDLLLGAGDSERTAAAFRRLLAAPFRHRDAVIHLTRLWTHGKLGEAVGPVEVLDALMPLARDLARPPRGEKLPPRLLRNLLALLVGGRKPLIVKILDQADPEDLRRWVSFADMAPDLPWEIAEPIRARAPSEDSGGAVTFWEGRAIYCTREGISRRREELRVLVEEKIPANQKALGEAAAHGDLSENAEWQAAIEEQRNLARRSLIMEEEMARAIPMEDQPRPDDVVCPGSRVVYVEEGTEGEKTISILGPWDVGDDVVSYRAPLAQGLLGRRAGEKLRISVPGGETEVTIRQVNRIV